MTVVLIFIMSVITSLTTAILIGSDVTKPTFVNDIINYPIYLVVDLIISALLCYFGGKVTAQYTRGQEVKYAFLLLTLTLMVYLPLVIESFKVYPIWYTISSLISICAAILLGAKASQKT